MSKPFKLVEVKNSKPIGSDRFYAKVIAEKDFGKGYWKTLVIGVFEKLHDVETKLGEYEYGYHNAHLTFYPFEQDGKWYALYAPENYTCTAVMSLPDCKQIAQINQQFCPVEFYVPKVFNEQCTEEHYTKFGFVSGCVWGDDGSWKVEYVDLSRVSEGIIKQDARFGYLELPHGLPLSRAIEVDWEHDDGNSQVSIATQMTFRFWDGDRVHNFSRDHVNESCTANHHGEKDGEVHKSYYLEFEGKQKGFFLSEQEAKWALQKALDLHFSDAKIVSVDSIILDGFRTIDKRVLPHARYYTSYVTRREEFETQDIIDVSDF